MKFLIIGASGFIGCHTFNYIRSLGYEVVGTQANSKQSELIDFNLFSDRIKARIDPSFFETEQPLVGIICSAFSRIDRCLLDREKSHQINVEKTCQLIDDFKALGVQPIFLSSDHVYDGKEGYYCEDDDANPINEYGRQKLAVETYLKEVFPDRFRIFRLSKIVGDNPQEAHPLSEWYQKIEAGEPIVCIEGQIFSPTLVRDVARGIVLSCEQELFGLYHLASPQFFPREELARQFARSLGRNIEILCKPQADFNFADQRPEKTYLDSTKFARETGMQFTSMREVFQAFAKNLKTARSTP